MKKCLSCGAKFSPAETACLSCGSRPELQDGFVGYAPTLAHGGGGFHECYFAELASLESENFWFRARNRLIIWALEKYCSGFQSMLEIGCGTGYVLSGIADVFPRVKLSGSEIFTAGLGFASERRPGINFMQIDARHIPFVDEFDVIGAFDVLEHIEEDEVVLAQIWEALTPGGTVLLSVPQHKWLWSAVDENACHVRRYSANDLYKKVRAAGFEVLRSTSFVSTLLPAMFASRMLQKVRRAQNTDASAELRLSPWLNSLFENMLDLEVACIRKGIDLPAGGSRLMVARKICSSHLNKE